MWAFFLHFGMVHCYAVFHCICELKTTAIGPVGSCWINTGSSFLKYSFVRNESSHISAKFGSNISTIISQMLPGCPQSGDRFDFSHARRHRQCNQSPVPDFVSMGVLTPPVFPFSIGWAGRRYNSVGCTTVLHCDYYHWQCSPVYKHQQTMTGDVIAGCQVDSESTPATTNTNTDSHHGWRRPC